VTSVPGRKPVIASVSGVQQVAAPLSGLLLTGAGAPIDATKALALQVVQADPATGKTIKETWGIRPQITQSARILELVKALQGQRVGSRAVVLTAAKGKTPARILVIDVLAQY
jgi:hypothetical protein